MSVYLTKKHCLGGQISLPWFLRLLIFRVQNNSVLVLIAVILPNASSN